MLFPAAEAVTFQSTKASDQRFRDEHDLVQRRRQAQNGLGSRIELIGRKAQVVAGPDRILKMDILLCPNHR